MNLIVVNESKMRRATVQAKLPLVQMAVRRAGLCAGLCAAPVRRHARVSLRAQGCSAPRQPRPPAALLPALFHTLPRYRS